VAASIVVIGASSFIGAHLLSSIPKRLNLAVKALVRRRDPAFENSLPEVRFFEGDLLMPESLEDILEPGCTVINLAYMHEASRETNQEALANLAEGCSKAGIKRFIQCSTAMVHGALKQDVICDDTVCVPKSLYETTKSNLEALLQTEYASRFEVVILRPTAVFGPRGKNLLKLVEELSRGSRIMNYLKACLFDSRRMNLVHVRNVTAALWFLADPTRSLSESVYLMSDDDQANNNYGYVRSFLIKHLDIGPDPLPILRMPSFLAQIVLKVTGNPRPNPRQVYIPKNLSSEGFVAPVDLDEGLIEFASWIREASSQ
jgi:nucleoside-diphosphate-sugar epimerase